jgi:hypothetical protein
MKRSLDPRNGIAAPVHHGLYYYCKSLSVRTSRYANRLDDSLHARVRVPRPRNLTGAFVDSVGIAHKIGQPICLVEQTNALHYNYLSAEVAPTRSLPVSLFKGQITF